MGNSLMTPSKAYRTTPALPDIIHQVQGTVGTAQQDGEWIYLGCGSGVGSLWDDGLGEDEDAGDHDGGSMDNSTYCGWTLHGIWQPAVCAHS